MIVMFGSDRSSRSHDVRPFVSCLSALMAYVVIQSEPPVLRLVFKGVHKYLLFQVDKGDPPFPRSAGEWWFGCKQ